MGVSNTSNRKKENNSQNYRKEQGDIHNKQNETKKIEKIKKN